MALSTQLFPYDSHEHPILSQDGKRQWTMRYIDEGPSIDGAGDETILCVHGNPTWSFYYRGVVERFSDSRRVIAVDHIGCGRSDKPSRDEYSYTLQQRCDDLVSLIDRLDLKRITLVAHDWGGAIGMATLMARRNRFIRIALLNTAAFPPPYVPWRIAACRFPILGTAAVRGLNAFAGLAVPMAMNRNRLTPEVASGLLHPYDSWNNRVAVDAFVRDIPMSPRHGTMETLKKLESDLPSVADMPIALIWGMKDWCFRVECLRRFQSVWPNAAATEIEDGGHYVIEDAPDETLEAIGQLLQQDVPG